MFYRYHINTEFSVVGFNVSGTLVMLVFHSKPTITKAGGAVFMQTLFLPEKLCCLKKQALQIDSNS